MASQLGTCVNFWANMRHYPTTLCPRVPNLTWCMNDRNPGPQTQIYVKFWMALDRHNVHFAQNLPLLPFTFLKLPKFAYLEEDNKPIDGVINW